MEQQENKVSLKELYERLNWTLDQKIDHSLGTIEAFLAENKNAKVAFSGGKDSTVMLALVRMININQPAIFANTTNEFTEILKFVRATDNVETVMPKTTFIKTVEEYGFPLISKKVARMIKDCRHPSDSNQATRTLYLTGIKRDGTKTKSFKLSKKWLHLIDAPFEITNRCCDFLKKEPMRDVNKDGVLVGTLASESQTRKAGYIKTGCINWKQNKCMPISIWTETNIWDYLKQRNIPYCDIYDKGEERTGCCFCGFGLTFDPTRFQRIKEREPKRFEQMMEIKNNGVPYWEAINYALKKKII